MARTLDVVTKPSSRPAAASGRKKGPLVPLDECARAIQAEVDALRGDAARRRRLERAYRPYLRGKRIYFFGGEMNYASAKAVNSMRIVRLRGCSRQDACRLY